MTGPCHISGCCRTPIEGHLFCEPHWRMVPPISRTLLDLYFGLFWEHRDGPAAADLAREALTHFRRSVAAIQGRAL